MHNSIGYLTSCGANNTWNNTPLGQYLYLIIPVVKKQSQQKKARSSQSSTSSSLIFFMKEKQNSFVEYIDSDIEKLMACYVFYYILDIMVCGLVKRRTGLQDFLMVTK